MDIAHLSETSVRIKGKSATFLIGEYEGRAKVSADAIIGFDDKPLESAAIEGVRVSLSGPGDFEVGGVKIVGIKTPGGTSYYMGLDNMVVLVAKASALSSKESLKDASAVILYADTLVDTSLLATIAPLAVVIYGPSAAATLHALGKESAAVSKYSVTKDKLPSEMEAILLQ